MECDSFTGDTSHYLLDPVLIATAPKSEIRQLPPVLDCHFWKFILYISPCKVSYCSPEGVFNQVCAYSGVNKHTQLVPHEVVSKHLYRCVVRDINVTGFYQNQL